MNILMWVVIIINAFFILFSLLFQGGRINNLEKSNHDLNYRLTCWRNCFSAPTPEKVFLWMSELQRLGEVMPTEQPIIATNRDTLDG